MSITALKSELKQLEKDQLIDLIAELYKKHETVKDHLGLILNQDEQKLYTKFKAKVYEAFFPKRGYDLKLKEGKKAISDFKKLNPSEELVADLMLFYVENGIHYTLDCGDISEPFYYSLESTYHAALKFIAKNKMLPQFRERAETMKGRVSHIGWGFYDSLDSSYQEFYN